MKAKLQLPKPTNWQDFETLCKKLWGEIWQCPEIKQNGRTGQAQHGVDISGIPAGYTRYFGIQCKGKDDYIHAQLTKKEIDAEIEKAKFFKPELQKLYFATTANKDTYIEEYIRLKDVENRSKSLFEVHIYSWEDIVDLVFENKRTHDFYVNSINFYLEHKVTVNFLDGNSFMDATCRKEKLLTYYRHKKSQTPEIPEIISSAYKTFLATDRIRKISGLGNARNKVNKSYILFGLLLKNTGAEALSHLKIEIDIFGNVEKIELGKQFQHKNYVFDLLPYRIKKHNEKNWQIIPDQNVLVPEDQLRLRYFSLRPLDDNGQLEIRWKLLSSELTESGSLFIKFQTKIHRKIKEIIISPLLEEYDDEPKFTDYYEQQDED